MTGFTTKPSRFRKVHGGPALESALESSDPIEAIVKVTVPGYVPPALRLRTRIDAMMMTGEAQAADLAELEADPNVESVSISRKLRVIE